MRVVLLYRPNSEGAGKAEDYAHEYHMRHPDRQIDLVNVDTRDGEEIARLHGITAYPAVLALSDDGGFLQLWQDEHLPMMNEIDFYMTH